MGGNSEIPVNRTSRSVSTALPVQRDSPEGALGRTPLHQAAMEGHAATCRLLLDRGAAVDARDRVWSCV